MSRKYNWFLFLFVVLSMHHSALLSQNTLVQDLRNEWFVYDQNKSALVPLVENIFNQKSINLYLDLNKYQDYHLSVDLPTKTSLLFENKIVFSSKKRSVKHFGIDSLKRIYTRGSILISIFSSDLKLDEISSQIIDKDSNQLRSSADSIMDISKREQNDYNDFFIMAIFIVLGSVVLVKQSLKTTFFDYLSVSSTFSIKPKSEALYSTGVFASSNILMFFLYGISLGFIVVMALVSLRGKVIIDLEIEKPLELVGVSLLVSLVLIFLMVMRYFLLRVVGGIFKMKALVSIQFFDYFRITFFILLVLFFALIFNFGTGGSLIHINEISLTFFFILTLCLRPLLIYLKLNKLSGNKNLHLFSYICGTELIPLIIITNIFLNI